MDEKLIRKVEQRLCREARWLDERRFPEWLELLTEDVHYWMPVRSSRYPRSSKAIAILDHERYGYFYPTPDHIKCAWGGVASRHGTHRMRREAVSG